MNKQKVNLQKWNITYKFGNCKFFFRHRLPPKGWTGKKTSVWAFLFIRN